MANLCGTTKAQEQGNTRRFPAKSQLAILGEGCAAPIAPQIFLAGPSKKASTRSFVQSAGTGGRKAEKKHLLLLSRTKLKGTKS
jgi:hypothetical protein